VWNTNAPPVVATSPIWAGTVSRTRYQLKLTSPWPRRVLNCSGATTCHFESSKAAGPACGV
jgi:hypothetical protein